MKRVVVIGAGPAGSAAAMGLTRCTGVEPVLLERYRLPRQKVCGSGLSPWTLTLLDKMGAGELVRRRAFRIDGAYIAGRDGGIELRGDHETAVLLREEFDHLLAAEAARRGADLRDGVSVKEIVRHGDRVVGVRTSEGEMEADLVVDCSGARGRFSRNPRPGMTLHTMLGWYEGVEGASDIVELFFDEPLRPHYGWIFPETSRRVNVGIVFDPNRDRGNARARFDQFVGEKLGSRVKHATQLGRLVGHPVHVGWWPTDLVRHGTLVAGEAGQLVDSATAEGIFHGLSSGLHAARVGGELLTRGEEPTAERLAPYEWHVRKQLGWRMALGRGLMETLRTPALDTALRFRHVKATRTLLSKAFAGLYHG